MEKVTPPNIPPPPYPGPPLEQYQPQPVIQTGQQPAYTYSTQQPQGVQPVKQVVVMQLEPTDVPAQMMCPYCQTAVITRTEYKNGMLTWLICGAIGLFLCWPLCWIPFIVKACKDVEHFCPTCNRVLHVHKRM